jgi:hypothetical protein
MYGKSYVAAMAALFGWADSISIVPDIQLPPTVVFAPAPSRNARKRMRPGRTYPHSSARQQARFKKQLEAGHHASWA